MGENGDTEIIEHHVDEEMEKKRILRSHGSSFMESVTPSERDGHSSTQSSHRLLAYSDALISIIATVMILPVAHTKVQDNEELKESLQVLLTTKIAVYLMTFLIVTVAWAAHIRSPVVFQSYVILAIVIFLPYISQSLKWCRSKAIGQVEETPDSMMFYTYHPNEPLSKERVEAFSDGVFAIVATLLILDICEDNVPDPVMVQKQYGGSLVAALQNYGPEYLAYFGSFATVALLWFVHHSLFLHVTRTTRFMGLLNTFSLAFVGGLPLAYQLTHEFPRNSRNELEAIQISCVIIFFAGVFQLAIWVAALFSERETLHPYVRYGGREHAFMLAKLALYPCVALGTFFLTCILSKFSASIFHLMEITVPFAFLLLRLLVRGGLALLRLIFCPDGPETRSALEEEEEEEARMPFNTMIT
ncbi:endosomal/lysosomal proton channel TMEM175 [Salvelinus sp. IW2-2015]|uniref:endosomal/lysosomal proton channel TMEM175 n=1 Tax=Salvelinus sp. IW2-2015 TaxID=2691554 RepID=UPI0038D3EA34